MKGATNHLNTGSGIGLEEAWQRVKGQLDKLQYFLEKRYMAEGSMDAMSISRKDYSEAYTTIYNLCIQKENDNNEEIYKRYGRTYETYLREKVCPNIRNKFGFDVIVEVLRRWENHEMMMKWLQRYFGYLDRFYVPHYQAPSLKVVGFHKFRDIIIEESKNRIIDAIAGECEKDRKNHEINRSAIRKVIEILQILAHQNDFVNDLIGRLVTDSQKFYRTKAAEWVELSCPDYLKSADDLLHRESERLNNIVTQTLHEKVNLILEKFNDEVLESYKAYLLGNEKGFPYMLEYKQEENLQLVYKLFLRLKKFDEICSSFREFIKRKGVGIMKEKSDQLEAIGDNKEKLREASHDKTFVENLFILWEDYHRILEKCFENHPQFEMAFRRAMESFLKIPMKISAPELLANYTDFLLRKRRGNLDDNEMEDKLTKTIKLFENIEDKDVYLNLFTQQLSKRLLSNISESIDWEKKMISKIASCCGPQYTTHLDGMLKDMSIANDINKDFLAKYYDDIKKMFPSLNPENVSVRVLSKAFWHAGDEKPLEIPIPSDILTLQSMFERFYMSTHQKKLLEWSHVWTTVVMNVSFGANKYELTMTMLQAAVLCLYEGRNELSYTEIRSTMPKLHEDFLKRILASLSGRLKLLEKSGEPKIISTSDFFRFNINFTFDLKRINLPLPHTDEIYNREKVHQDRDMAIEAAIVRVMKHRKALEFQNLLHEVMQKLSQFEPDPKQIKKKIDVMLEKEFLERDKNDPRVLKYLA